MLARMEEERQDEERRERVQQESTLIQDTLKLTFFPNVMFKICFCLFMIKVWQRGELKLLPI